MFPPMIPIRVCVLLVIERCVAWLVQCLEPDPDQQWRHDHRRYAWHRQTDELDERGYAKPADPALDERGYTKPADPELDERGYAQRRLCP